MDQMERELCAVTPKSNGGKLRKYLPTIVRKLNEGVSARDILFVLKAHGIVMTEGTFRSYVHRFRKQKKKIVSESNLVSSQPSPTVVPNDVRSTPSAAKNLNEAMHPDPNRFMKAIKEKERRYKEHQQSLKKQKQ